MHVPLTPPHQVSNCIGPDVSRHEDPFSFCLEDECSQNERREIFWPCHSILKLSGTLRLKRTSALLASSRRKAKTQYKVVATMHLIHDLHIIAM